MTNVNVNLVKKLRERTGLGIMDCKKSLIESQGNIELAILNLRKLGYIKAADKANNLSTEGSILVKKSKNNDYGVLIELNCETDFVSKSLEFIKFGNIIINTAINECIDNLALLRSKFEEQRIVIISQTGENIYINRLKLIKGEMIGSYLHNTRIGVLVSVINAKENLLKNIAMHIAANNPEYINPEDITGDILEKECDIYKSIAMKSGKSDKIIQKIIEGHMNKFINSVCLTKQFFIMDPSITVGQFLNKNNIKIKSFVRFELGKEF